MDNEHTEEHGKLTPCGSASVPSMTICQCSDCKERVWVYKNPKRYKFCPFCGVKLD